MKLVLFPVVVAIPILGYPCKVFLKNVSFTPAVEYNTCTESLTSTNAIRALGLYVKRTSSSLQRVYLPWVSCTCTVYSVQ